MYRIIPAIGIPVLALAACAPGTQQAATLEQAKAWATGIAGAVNAAAASYAGQHADQVRQAADGLVAASAAFQQVTDVSTARSAALSIVASAQQVVPIVAPALGPNAIYVSMGMAMVQAFIAALPAPPNVPATPPASMQTALNGVRQ